MTPKFPWVRNPMIWPLSRRRISIRFSLTRYWVEVPSHVNQTNQYLTSVLVQTKSCVTTLASACAMIIIDCCPLLSVTVVYYRLTSITVWYCHSALPHGLFHPRFLHALCTTSTNITYLVLEGFHLPVLCITLQLTLRLLMSYIYILTYLLHGAESFLRS